MWSTARARTCSDALYSRFTTPSTSARKCTPFRRLWGIGYFESRLWFLHSRQARCHWLPAKRSLSDLAVCQWQAPSPLAARWHPLHSPPFLHCRLPLPIILWFFPIFPLPLPFVPSVAPAQNSLCATSSGRHVGSSSSTSRY